MAMNNIDDLIARARRRAGKTARTIRNGHNVRVIVDAKGKLTWKLLKGENWVRVSHALVHDLCEG